MFHPSRTGSTVGQHASGHDNAVAHATSTPATTSQTFNIGERVSLIQSLNASSGRNLHDAATGARAASGQISTAADAAAETAAAGLEMHQSLTNLLRTFSELRRDIDGLLANTRAA